MVNGKVYQKWMFPSLSTKLEDIEKDKQLLLNKVKEYNKKLLEIKNKTTNEVLLKEIDYVIVKNKLLKETFDIEAKKLNSDYKIKDDYPNYDYFSKKIYWVDKSDIYEIWVLPCNRRFENYKISIDWFKQLLKNAEDFFPNIDIQFWSYANFSVNKDMIKIPIKNFYNIQEIITLFFHEMSHYVRYLNTKRNLGFFHIFSTNYKLEEWLALYNEHYYWNQILNYGEYYPYYHKVYNVLIKKLSPEEKFEQMYKILSCKWFDKEKVKKYYIRFYRFAPMHKEDFLLKESIYYFSYQNVKKYLDKWISLDYLMSSKWDLETIGYFLKWKNINNIDYKSFFEKMVIEIKKSFKL